MKIKPCIIASIASPVLIAGLIALCLFLQSPKPANPNLMIYPKVFQYPDNAEPRFLDLLEKDKLRKIIFQEPVNISYPREKWSGRVKYAGVSYHALFSLDNSRINIKLKKLQAQGISFSLYNPNNSRLFYIISIKDKNKEIPLYKGFYDKETLARQSINLPRSFDDEVELVLETKGRGIGAWINPRLTIPQKKPGIYIVVVLDTLRYDHTSLYGYSRKTTPTLDQLSKEAVVFREAYSTTSWTLPAHVSLFSGKNLEEHGVLTPNDKISTQYPLVAEVFQEQGYLTAAFTGGGFLEDSFGFARGFQVYSNSPGRTFDMESAQRVFNHFKNYIEGNWGNNLFVFLHTYQMHAPYKAPHEYIDRINPNTPGNLKTIRNFLRESSQYYDNIEPQQRQMLIDLYDASILYTDEKLIGQLIEYLKNKGVYDDTMLVILSDHGEEFYDHQSWEHGHTLYKELIKIPLLIKYPHHRKKGNENALTSIADLPGMILEESGLHYDENVFKNDSGKSKRLLPVLLPLSPIIQQFSPKVSLVDKDHHFIYNIIDKQKLQFFTPPPPEVRQEEVELYEERDYQEKTNVYKRKMSTVRRYAQYMQKYLGKIKGVKMDAFTGDKELEEKLKSLGYLNTK